MSTALAEIGARIAAERARRRYSVSSAAEAAGIARDTWKKVEAGQSVLDKSRAAALELLELDRDGLPLGPASVHAGTSSQPAEPILSDLSETVARLGGHDRQLDELARRVDAIEDRVAHLEDEPLHDGSDGYDHITPEDDPAPGRSRPRGPKG